MVDNYAAFFNCTPVGHKAIHFSWLGPELFVCCLAHRGSTGVFFFSFAPGFSKLFGAQGSPLSGSLLNPLSPPAFLIHQGGYHDLFVCPW